MPLAANTTYVNHVVISDRSDINAACRYKLINRHFYDAKLGGENAKTVHLPVETKHARGGTLEKPIGYFVSPHALFKGMRGELSNQFSCQ